MLYKGNLFFYYVLLSIFVSVLLEKDMNRIKGILYAAVSSATFGLAPFFSISLLAIGYSSFEVLTYPLGSSHGGIATVRIPCRM